MYERTQILCRQKFVYFNKKKKRLSEMDLYIASWVSQPKIFAVATEDCIF